MTPDTHQSFSDTTLCAFTASLYIHLYLMCYYAWHTMYGNKTCIPYDGLLHTKGLLYCQQCIVLLEQSWPATLHVAVFFQLIVYANIKITKRY